MFETPYFSNLFKVIVIGLSASYIVFTLTNTNGVFGIFTSYRKLLNFKPFTCSYCMSFWVSLAITCLMTYQFNFLEIILHSFASAAISCYFVIAFMPVYSE